MSLADTVWGCASVRRGNYVGTPSGTLLPPNGDVTGSASIKLDGYTVLDASGNVISDASVTPQNVPGYALDFTPEPGTSALILMGLGALVAAPRLRRNRRS